jgi:hypothetical protein
LRTSINSAGFVGIFCGKMPLAGGVGPVKKTDQKAQQSASAPIRL